jgi:L-ascorbate metabolism protein UlaG (beta-lactamase superfamily)
MNTKSLCRTFTLVCCLLFGGGSLFAQEGQRPLQYWNNPDGMLQEQAVLLFEQVDTILDKYPPSAMAGDERKLALFALDSLLHDVRLDNTKALADYVDKRFQHVSEKLKNEKLKENEIVIHKLFNHGYVIHTPSVTIGFDIFRGGRPRNPFVSDAVIETLVSQCDILFISHEHGDHADQSVAQLFCDQKKTVIAPPGLWEKENMSPHIRHLRGESVITEKIFIPARNAELTVKVFPGHQGDLINNVYAVTTPEGFTVMQTGDQANDADMNWITKVRDEVNVDVLLVQCWMPQIEKSVDGIKPKLIITGHENEMGHSIDHRESFWLTFRRFANVQVPWIVPAWGESFFYR